MRPTSMIRLHRPDRSASRWAATSVKMTVVVTTFALSLGHGLPARAEISGCMSDPVVLLSNGMTVDMSAAINDVATDVVQVAYTLHAPVGTFVVGWQVSDGPLGPKETLQFYADNVPNTYNTTTVVSTLTPHISAVATTQVVSALASAGGSRAGWAVQPLSVQVTP